MEIDMHYCELTVEVLYDQVYTALADGTLSPEVVVIKRLQLSQAMTDAAMNIIRSVERALERTPELADEDINSVVRTHAARVGKSIVDSLADMPKHEWKH